MAAKQDTPESLTALVGDALAQLDDKVTGWTHEVDRNRVHFRGTGPDFAVRDKGGFFTITYNCLLYTSPSPRDATLSRMPSSA